MQWDELLGRILGGSVDISAHQATRSRAKRIFQQVASKSLNKLLETIHPADFKASKKYSSMLQ